MGVRSSIAGSLTRAAKAFGGNEPAAMRQAAEQVSQMGPQDPFSPGEPIGPYDGYSRQPRSHNYVTGTNIATRPRTHERVSFATLRGLIESYDVASIAIWHRIDSIRSLDWKLMAADGYGGDVTDAIATGMAALKKPDRESAFEGWLAKWLWDVLAYDAGSLYRMRNRAGRVVGLAPVDGSTLAPLLDYWGNTPQEPAEAYVQYINGLPWNWLTKGDLIYEPFRPRTNSPYGQPPIETVILNANTDLRFQVYFLQRFTQGNVPEAFASAPESWSPDVIEQWQNYWDGFMYGEQAVKHQVKWIPGGSTFAWSNEKDFSDTFSLFMMRKTCAAFHVVPSDLGFTEDVNRSSGESQADVQHKVGELPFGRYIERILTSFLADDLGLPLKFGFDWGEEQDDRLAQAQADDIYIKNGTVGASEVREWRFGEPEPEGRTVPRFIFSSRAGPIPLNSLFGVAGAIDQATAAPDADAALPREVFTDVQGVTPSPALAGHPLAEIERGPSAIPAGLQTVSKEDGATTGITTATGITSYDGPGERDDDDDEDRDASVAKEMAAFRRFEKARRRAGEWRDFRFESVDTATAGRLNAGGRLTVRKDAVPGLTPTSGMISLDLPDGLITPVPGGVDDFHCTVVYLGPEVDDEAFAVACQRARDAAAAMPGPLDATVTGVGTFPPSPGSEGTVPAWAPVLLPDCATDLREALADLSASEHPDWHPHVTLAYLSPGDPLPPPVPAFSVTFTALSVHRGDQVERFPLGPPAPECCGGDCCAGGCCGGESGCTCGPATVAKAATSGPKAPAGKWPGWRLADKAAAYWTPLILAEVASTLTPALLSRMAADYLKAFPDQDGAAPGKQQRNDAAYAWLVAWLAAAGVTLDVAALAAGILTDGYLIGAVSAAAVVAGSRTDTGAWQPGDAQAAQDQVAGLGEGDALAALLALGAGAAAAAITAGFLRALARVLAGPYGDRDKGALAAALAAALAGAAGGALALGIVLDLLYSSAGTAALDYYPERATGSFSWATDPTLQNCAICLGNEAADPRPLGEPWPSGDTDVHIHTKCGCMLVPS